MLDIVKTIATNMIEAEIEAVKTFVSVQSPQNIPRYPRENVCDHIWENSYESSTQPDTNKRCPHDTHVKMFVSMQSSQNIPRHPRETFVTIIWKIHPRETFN